MYYFKIWFYEKNDRLQKSHMISIKNNFRFNVLQLICFIENIPNKTFGLNICMGIRIRILLITNTYHLARVILLHRAFLFSTTKSEWEINLFIQAESEVEIVRFCLVVRCVFCIKEEEVEDKLCSNTWNSTFIFAL